MIWVRVPATSANCCVGFDSMGLAVNWYSRFSFEKSDELVITGCDPAYANADNLVVTSFARACEYIGVNMPAFHLHIDSDIPLARGLGSSSCCVVAGVAGANAWFQAGLSNEQLLEIATRIEGHPDNVAPALYGQITCCAQDQGMEMVRLSAADWKGLAIIPPYEVSTAQARRLLPENMTYGNAVKQVANALVFVQALSQGLEDVAAKVCEDYLHEPYRKRLIPEYEEIKKKCLELKLPVWISGSGSTMMAMARDERKIWKLKSWMETRYHHIKLVEVEIDRRGTEVFYE